MEHNREASESSDDSSFYGDADTIQSLKQRVQSFEPDQWVVQHQGQTGWAQQRAHRIEGAAALHNPYAGVPYAWQLTESVEDFLTRLPPATTDQTLQVPWIYICNPYIQRVPKSESLNQTSKGNEDEGPEEDGSRRDVVLEGGMERLEILSTFVRDIPKFGRAPSTTEREKTKERSRAVLDILHLAHAGKVRAGKWMLFCHASEVNEVWSIVAKATANNELGIAAKVAPRNLDADPRKERLICVYTNDFMDKVDIGRVAQRLRELKLVVGKSKKIYYKPDIFTYLGISSGNPWGLKASIYNSSDVFATEQNSKNAQ